MTKGKTVETRRWRGLEFEVPEGLADESVLTFTEPTDGVPGYSVTVAFAPPLNGTALKAYVSDQLKQLGHELPGYKPISSSESEVTGAKAITVEHQAKVDGLPLRQVQTYIDAGTRIVILTATGRDDARLAPKALMEAFVQKLRMDLQAR